MLTLPAATPFTVMVIPLTDTVAFVLSADTARKLFVGYALRLEGHGQRGALPFHHRGAGRRHGMPVAAVTVLRSSAIDGRPTLVTFTVRVITSFAVTALPIADPATEHIDRAVREADFIGTGIAFIKPRQQRLLPLLSGHPRQREAGISGRFLPLPGRSPVCIFIIEIAVVIGLSGRLAGRYGL